jgi:hypothetical protein
MRSIVKEMDVVTTKIILNFVKLLILQILVHQNYAALVVEEQEYFQVRISKIH